MRFGGLWLTLFAVLSVGMLADETEKAGSGVPPMPKPAFTDSTQAEQFAEGLKLLEAEEYADAKKRFGSLRRIAPEGAERAAAERGYLESMAGLELVKIQKYLEKGRLRKVLSACEKALKKYARTDVGVTIEEIRQKCHDEIYFVVEDFEKSKKDEKADDEGDDDDGEGEGEGEGGRGQREQGGESGFGLNTRIVGDVPPNGKSQQSLEWRTGRELSFITFDKVKGKVSDYYRYLRITLRAKDGKKAPPLRLLFDCEEGGLNRGGGGGGGRRGGGRRGAAFVLQRQGFHLPMKTKGSWQEIVLDLRKFQNVGDVTWDDVRALRIIHMPGGEGRITIDSIVLERE